MKRVSRARLVEALPDAARPLALRVLEEAERRALAVHLVGGPVRDFLLGRPVRDVDLLVEAQAGEGAPELARAVGGSGDRVVTHDRFGTVRIESGGAALDLATARAERYARPGALPEVRVASLEEDLARRDFSVNALAAPMTSAAQKGRPAIVDLASGLADLDAGVLRVLHERSFHDDPTRALRAARLAPRLGFRPARSTASALRAALRDGAFGGVSGERFRAEIEKLFEDAGQGLDPSRALRLLADWHVLGALEPGLALAPSAAAPLRRLGRALAEPPLGAPQARALPTGLMLWLAPADAGLRRRALRRLAVQGAAAQAIAAYPERRDALLRVLARARGRGACDALLSPLPPELLLALYASAPTPLRRRILRFARDDRAAGLPIGGDALVALGLRGAAIGAALARLRAAWLDREVRTSEELQALAAELARGKRAPARKRHEPPASP